MFASFCFPIEINDAVPLSYLVQPDLDQIWQKLVAGVWGGAGDAAVKYLLHSAAASLAAAAEVM